MRVSKDLADLNPHLKKKDLKNARVKGEKESEKEKWIEDLLRQLQESGTPLPTREFPFAKIVRRNYAADLAYIEERILIEYNGGTWNKERQGHSTGTGLRRDYYKQNLAQLLGYRDFEVDASMVRDGTALKTIRCALGIEETYEQRWQEYKTRRVK